MTAGRLTCRARRALTDSRKSHLSGAQGHLGVLGPAELGELVQDQRELVGQRGVLPAKLVLDQRNVTQIRGVSLRAGPRSEERHSDQRSVTQSWS